MIIICIVIMSVKAGLLEGGYKCSHMNLAVG